MKMEITILHTADSWNQDKSFKKKMKLKTARQYWKEDASRSRVIFFVYIKYVE